MTHRMSTEATLSYSKIVEKYAHFFDRPEIRLRFLTNTLKQHSLNSEKLDRLLGRFGFIKRTPLYGRFQDVWFYNLMFQELKQLLPSATKERHQLLRLNKAPFSARLLFRCYQIRYVLLVACVLLMMSAPFGIYAMVMRSSHRVNDYLAQRYGSHKMMSDNASGQSSTPLNGGNYLPDYKAEKVWLVERKDNYERYSNGGRVLTDYETANHARGYYVLPRGKGSAADAHVHREPVGIVYHTSESDLLPFISDNNQSIEAHTRGLLEYVKRNRSYNYVIDRFGQMYRIVRDEEAANHAGNSVWADARGIYVGLNESFLGVCFETRSDAGSLNEQLTEAQIISGRLLTQILRSRYNIDDANCVTHGLVSVNPTNMLICYHHDWVRNFPFEAFGLSDKYKVAPASVSEFGFTYDEEIVTQIGGEVWPGVKLAEEEFKRRAAEAAIKPEEMRRQMRELYRQQMNLASRIRSTTETEVSRRDARSKSIEQQAGSIEEQAGNGGREFAPERPGMRSCQVCDFSIVSNS
ncbi:MAG: hypothetical protein QOD00_2845 [Blastocatellia bacterium]|nr:hypothetical protein [Blastocatellia bacterium]